MGQFIYANSFKIAINDSEVSIEFATSFPKLDDAGGMKGIEVVGEPIRVIMNRVLANQFINGIANGMAAPAPVQVAGNPPVKS